MKQWKNTDNVDWYENIPIEHLRGIAIRGGMEEGCDVDLIYSFIKDTQSLIEPGAGYGRGIKHLIKNGYQGKIYALERSKNFIKYLIKEFKARIEIIEADSSSYHPVQKFDVVMAVWGFIAEFPLQEQLNMVKHLASWLNEKGLLILETLASVPMNATSSTDAFYEIDTEYGKVWGHMPIYDEINEYGAKAGLKLVKRIDYKTSIGRDRILYIFSK